MQGQYILDRWMVSMIKDICQNIGVVYTSYSDDWLLELSKGEENAKIFGYKFSLNDAAATATAGDKVATYQLLTAHGIQAVEHRLVRTKASQSTDWDVNLGKIVIKPLDGTSGHGIALLDAPTEVTAYITQHPYIAAWAVSPYVDIISERRFVLLDGKILCQYKKLGVMRGGLQMFNLGLGATAEHSKATAKEVDLALNALRISGLRLAAIDIIQTLEGYQVLEINDGIMMENYMRQSDTNKKQAKEVYAAIIKALFI